MQRIEREGGGRRQPSDHRGTRQQSDDRAVGRGLLQRISHRGAGRAGAVLDGDRTAEALLDRRRDGASHDVGTAARREADPDADGPIGKPGLGDGRQRQQSRAGSRQQGSTGNKDIRLIYAF